MRRLAPFLLAACHAGPVPGGGADHDGGPSASDTSEAPDPGASDDSDPGDTAAVIDRCVPLDRFTGDFDPARTTVVSALDGRDAGLEAVAAAVEASADSTEVQLHGATVVGRYADTEDGSAGFFVQDGRAAAHVYAYDLEPPEIGDVVDVHVTVDRGRVHVAGPVEVTARMQPVEILDLGAAPVDGALRDRYVHLAGSVVREADPTECPPWFFSRCWMVAHHGRQDPVRLAGKPNALLLEAPPGTACLEVIGVVGQDPSAEGLWFLSSGSARAWRP